MSKTGLADRRVWITGASSGIGRAVTVALAAQGCRVAVSARSRDALEELVAEVGEGRAFSVPLDVTDRQANLDAAKRIQERFGGLDIAVLNAGGCEFVNVRKLDSGAFDRMMRTNFQGMVYGIEAALPLLRESPHPLLAGMSSTAGYRGLPRAAAYGASKAAVRYMLESLRIDLLPEGIPVSIICPGFVRTPLTAHNDFPMPMIVDAGYAARCIVKGIARQAPVIAFPRALDVTLKLLGLFPSRLYARLFNALDRRPKR